MYNNIIIYVLYVYDNNKLWQCTPFLLGNYHTLIIDVSTYLNCMCVCVFWTIFFNVVNKYFKNVIAYIIIKIL